MSDPKAALDKHFGKAADAVVDTPDSASRVDTPSAAHDAEAVASPYRKAAHGKPLVVIRELRKSFLHMGRKLEVLKGIDVEIHQGEVVAIVGKSGAGKSTLLQCMGTLDLPSSGIIKLGDDYLVGLSSAALADIRNRTIGFVFQFHHLLPEFNALENVMMPGLIQGMARGPLEQRARALLRDVGLEARMTHRPGELSGGEQQRVALARALVLEPKLILADEPTGNLDTATSDAIHKLFFDINEKHGTTIVVVTHNLKLAESMPRVIRMLDGKIIDDSAAPPDPVAVDEGILERSRALGHVSYAGFWHRAAARIVDTFAMWLLAVAGGYGAIAVGRTMGGEPHLERFWSWQWIALAYVVGTILQLLYHAVAETMGGATFGKMIFGLRVRDESLRSARFGAAALRNLLMFVDAILFGLVGYVGMKGSLIKQRFGDSLSQTVVVEAPTLPEKDESASIAGAALGAVIYVVSYLVIVLLFLF